MGAKYYMLVASLPRMPDLDKAVRLPITELRLRQRLKALDDDAKAQLDAVMAVLRLHSQPVGLSNSQVIETYRRAWGAARHPMLRDLLEFRMDQWTILAALRMRRRGLSSPQPKGDWGMGTRKHWIINHWDRGDFGLGHVYPWLDEVRQLLEAGRAAAVQRLLWRQLWDRLSAYQNADAFGLGDVFGTVLKWGILRLWLGQDAQASAVRFEKLSEEIARDKLFQLMPVNAG